MRAAARAAHTRSAPKVLGAEPKVLTDHWPTGSAEQAGGGGSGCAGGGSSALAFLLGAGRFGNSCLRRPPTRETRRPPRAARRGRARSPAGGGGRARARSARRRKPPRWSGGRSGVYSTCTSAQRQARGCACARLRCGVGGRSGGAARRAALSGCSWIWRRKQLASYGLCTAGREESVQAARKGRRLNGRRGEGRRLWWMEMKRTFSGEAKPVYSRVNSS